MVKNAEQFRKDLVRSLPLYFMLLPGLIYIFINNYIPALRESHGPADSLQRATACR